MARRQRLAAGGVLAGGLIVLAVGVAVALDRNDRGVDSRSDRAVAQEARYDAALRQVASAPARFEVSFGEFELRDLPALTAGTPGSPPYRLVSNEVATRLRTGRPPVRPDFGSLASEPDDLFARVFREGRVYERELTVVALLLTQTTPGRSGVRLEVNRLALRGYEHVFDLASLTPTEGTLEGIPEGTSEVEYGLRGTQGPAVVEWTSPGVGARALVPLGLIHTYWPFDRPENAAIKLQAGSPGWRVMSNVVLLPRRLLVQRVGAKEVELSLEDALRTPLRLDAGADR